MQTYTTTQGEIYSDMQLQRQRYVDIHSYTRRDIQTYSYTGRDLQRYTAIILAKICRHTEPHKERRILQYTAKLTEVYIERKRSHDLANMSMGITWDPFSRSSIHYDNIHVHVEYR